MECYLYIQRTLMERYLYNHKTLVECFLYNYGTSMERYLLMERYLYIHGTLFIYWWNVGNVIYIILERFSGTFPYLFQNVQATFKCNIPVMVAKWNIPLTFI